MNFLRWLATVTLGIFSLTVIGGCSADPHSNKPTGTIVVTVTNGGTPVTDGYVSLTSSKTGLGGGGSLGANGSVKLDDIVLGEYVVTITPPPVTNDPNPDFSKYKVLPQKYRSEATSTLKATVTKGISELKVDLKQ